MMVNKMGAAMVKVIVEGANPALAIVIRGSTSE
jgi:hypothetical protein